MVGRGDGKKPDAYSPSGSQQRELGTIASTSTSITFIFIQWDYYCFLPIHRQHFIHPSYFTYTYSIPQQLVLEKIAFMLWHRLLQKPQRILKPYPLKEGWWAMAMG